ncbi:MAG: hypothetical protein H6648_04870 [Caldilineae bacterium]|nr:hypothetical protein [Chloroflexota bacterium]MCB9176473.1 hypothetical protein [Caldilineae bacterium]
MPDIIRRFAGDESGAEMVEWAVVTIVLLVATVPVLIQLKDSLLELFQTIFTVLQEDPDDQWVP